ncbi:hypothetical protein [uncultured Thomasclavelia sp.]|uniref:hypothetical protein n=1 Tax=uncultured Thomasclavelia sp. TaxID=3025759 RepID=UPI00259706BB|nr:hypothetical protein [uncultured Thomasclavelia sp.]
MEKYDLKNKTVQLHNILFASTSSPDYEMDRTILLEELEDLKYGEYVVVEGGHCSCYDFDDCEWYATKYTKEELIKLAESHQNDCYCDSSMDMYEYVLKKLK